MMCEFRECGVFIYIQFNFACQQKDTVRLSHILCYSGLMTGDITINPTVSQSIAISFRGEIDVFGCWFI